MISALVPGITTPAIFVSRAITCKQNRARQLEIRQVKSDDDTNKASLKYKKVVSLDSKRHTTVKYRQWKKKIESFCHTLIYETSNMCPYTV
jgi:hypothetical protein